MRTLSTGGLLWPEYTVQSPLDFKNNSHHSLSQYDCLANFSSAFHHSKILHLVKNYSGCLSRREDRCDPRAVPRFGRLSFPINQIQTQSGSLYLYLVDFVDAVQLKVAILRKRPRLCARLGRSLTTKGGSFPASMGRGKSLDRMLSKFGRTELA